MKTKLILILATLATLSTQAFADKKELKLFNALVAVGVDDEPGMGAHHIFINDIECAFSFVENSYQCVLQDMTAGQSLNANGKKAEAIFDALFAVDASQSHGLGVVYLGATSVTCNQEIDRSEEPSVAKRTVCSTYISKK